MTKSRIPSILGSRSISHHSICFSTDNCTAMSHTNNLGGTRSQTLSNLAKELWNYGLNRNLIISGIHIPEKLNVLADHKSRIFKDSIESMLNPSIFKGVVARLGRPDIDLFAARLNHQISEIVSWWLELNAVATDAFNLTWNYHLSYLFLPFSLIPLCLKKIQRDQAECIPIAPVWKSRPWYPIHLSMLSHQPLLLPQSQFFLQLPGTNKIHTLCTQKSFRLAAWKTSGKHYKLKDFLRRCLTFSSWRKSITRQYESAWRSWSDWCDSRQINYLSTSIKNIPTYLAHLFHQKGLQYRTINVYRLAVSAFHIPIDGMIIGKHPLVTTFMRGFCLRPPEPKYFVTWDVNQVLNLLKSWSPADSISLKQLTLKLFMPAALISAAKKSSLDKFDLRFRFFKSNRVLFKVPGLTKSVK